MEMLKTITIALKHLVYKEDKEVEIDSNKLIESISLNK